jgi:hypothetical protein
MIHPITFCFPEEKIINTIPRKIKVVSSLIPGKMSTYIYNNETDYYNEYRQSLFAITTKKAGWDCMRHYEIMANGCIPYFPSIEACPVNTMALLPKDLLLKGNLLYEKYKDTDISNIELSECNELINKYLVYLRNNLTTVKMAKYILNKANITPLRILYLSQDPNPDYLRCTVLHGFKSLYGSECHDYPKIPHIYKAEPSKYNSLYGKGITYTNLLDSNTRNDALDARLKRDIDTKYYDVVIYGSYHRGMPYYDLVNKIYDPDKIILICGEDEHNCSYKHWVDCGHHVFVRELK